MSPLLQTSWATFSWGVDKLRHRVYLVYTLNIFKKESRDETRLRKSHRVVARHTRPADFANAAMGAAPRLRHQPGDSHRFGRSVAGGHRLALSSAAPAGTQEMDQGRL